MQVQSRHPRRATGGVLFSSLKKFILLHSKSKGEWAGAPETLYV